MQGLDLTRIQPFAFLPIGILVRLNNRAIDETRLEQGLSLSGMTAACPQVGRY